MKKILLVIILLCISNFGYTQWIQQSPYPTNSDLYGSAIINSQTFLAAGQSGLVLKTSNAGINWTPFVVGINETMSALYFLNSSTGWVVGYNGKLYKTTDSGNSWFPLSLPSYSQFPRTIFFANENTGWIGDNGIYRTTNGGNNWLSGASVPAVTSLHFNNENLGVACSYIGVIGKTTNGGINWQTVLSNPAALYSVKLMQNGSGWASGDTGRIYKTTDFGSTWQMHQSGVTGRLNSIFIQDSLNVFICGQNGMVLHTTNSGVNWILQNTQIYDELYSINFFGVVGWAVGYGGKIIFTSDSGKHWQIKSNGTGDYLASINFINNTTGWAAGGGGNIYKTTNSGVNWLPLNSGTHEDLSFKSGCFLDSLNGWIAGYNSISDSSFILRTKDGGITWIKSVLTRYDEIRPVFFINKSLGWFSTDYGKIYKSSDGGVNWDTICSSGSLSPFQLQFINSNTGFMCDANSEILKTTNGGSNWEHYNVPPGGIVRQINSISFVNETTGWLTKYFGGVYKTTNGGVNWFTQDGATIDPLWTIYFLNENYGWACGDNGALVRTTNGGANWKKYDTGTHEQLYSLHFIDINTGWICGTGGIILRSTSGGTSFIRSIGNIIPDNISLSQNYPNPFNPTTKINYEIKSSGFVSLKVYDLLGKEVATLVNEKQNAGSYAMDFNSTEFNLPSGIYYYTLSTDGFVDTKKMVLIK
ncbi:MAG: T9SS type A sorting domain-containing protein [Bacteroidetes bacterium]|nr:T9SS type A sorting domain-containing protein [Bacteroidota bacterium]